MLGQLSAICVTVCISANKLLLLSIVLCLLPAALLGKLPASERESNCMHKGGWVAPLVICVLHGVLIGFVDGTQGVNMNIAYQSMTF